MVSKLLAIATICASLAGICQAFTMPSITKVTKTLQSAFFEPKETLVLPPPESKQQSDEQTCIILLPGCQLRPEQYEDVAREIQQTSEQAVWVAIPKFPLNVAIPLIVPGAVKGALNQLQKEGYKGQGCFVGGHSLGGVFLPTIFDESNGLREEQVLGTIQIGSFQARSTPEDSPLQKLPSLTMTGDLDGMVRTSRIAEDYHRNVKDDGEEAKLHHAVVLVEGMNHFGFVQGDAPMMKQLRDLPQELSRKESVLQVAKAIGTFIDVHNREHVPSQDPAKAYLLDQINDTADYLQPLIEALKLEGSQHVGCDPAKGSPWTTKMQQELLAPTPKIKELQDVTFVDESHASWYVNPFAEVPFYHPKVTKSKDSIQLETVSDPVYEKTDSAFDGGFFSNAVSELRCKLNTPQAVVEEATGQKVPFLPPQNFAKKLNQRTIDWALENAPARVQRRYEASGIQLIPGDDISHNNGPAWIWSYLSYGKSQTKNGGKPSRELRSHVMVTPTDHPIRAVGGKMYAKILSPAKALDWMYTDSLRKEVNPLAFLINQGMEQPSKNMKTQPAV